MCYSISSPLQCWPLWYTARLGGDQQRLRDEVENFNGHYSGLATGNIELRIRHHGFNRRELLSRNVPELIDFKYTYQRIHNS